jgi:hypothetical protein
MSDQMNTPKSTLVTHSFQDRVAAERAYDDILARGYESGDIHVIMSDKTRKAHFGKDSAHVDMGNKSLKGGAVGGVVGGAVGATLVGLAAAAATVTVPILGLVIVGPLAGALAGGAAGAATGGLLGLLIGAGIPEAQAKIYESDVNNGAIVIGVNPKREDDTKYFEKEWKETPVRN